MSDALAPTKWQRNVLATPRECDLALLGGKGSGKSALVPFLVMRDEQEFGSDSRSLYVRKSHGGAQEFMLSMYEALVRAYGIRGVTLNSQTGLFKFGKATLQVDQLAEPKDLQKHWGKNYSLVICDETGEYNGLDLVDKLRASLRPPSGIPARMILIGNPGGPNHSVLLKTFVAGVAPWTPTLDRRSGRQFIYCPSTYRDNPHIDQADYLAQLKAACCDDPELMKAWADGSFAVAKGGYFSSVIDESRNMIEPWTQLPGPTRRGDEWNVFISIDWGSSAPADVQIVAESPGATVNGQFISRGSLVIVDELATNTLDSLTLGLQWTTAKLGEAVVEMCAKWNCEPVGCCDDAAFAKTGSTLISIASELQQAGVYVYPSGKGGRVEGWQRMRQLLADAGKVDKPGLFIARNCEYWWSTVPFLPRDPRKPEDLDSRGPDHSADCTRMSIQYLNQQTVRQSSLWDTIRV